MTKHTPGPWHVGVKQAEKIVYDHKGWAIANCTVYHGHEDSEPTENARLIAAAPDLLDSIDAYLHAKKVQLLEETGNTVMVDSETLLREAETMMKAAIAKAEGKQL